MNKAQTIFRITGKVQHYDWGGYDFIPSLLGMTNNARKPFAEFWLGTHHKSPSAFIAGDKTIDLSTITDLPYLLKLLDIREMLSIQVHPTKKAAEAGFAKENKEQIPLDAPNRNYRDDNHKPELIMALGEFWLLHGFKTEDLLKKTMGSLPEFSGLLDIFNRSGYKQLYETAMTMPQENVNKILGPIMERIIPEYQNGALTKNEESYWVAKAGLTFNKEGLHDRGIFSIYFLNLLQLKNGEAIYQAPGLLHAYLEGKCVEIMANSDNVLRGGLTTKHIDVNELMKHVLFKPVVPEKIKGKQKNNEKLFQTAATDFELGLFLLTGNETATFFPVGYEIIFLLAGNVECKSGNTILRLKQGQAAIIFPGNEVTLKALPEAELYRAYAPVPNPEQFD